MCSTQASIETEVAKHQEMNNMVNPVATMCTPNSRANLTAEQLNNGCAKLLHWDIYVKKHHMSILRTFS